jgi:hypothetical protein
MDAWAEPGRAGTFEAKPAAVFPMATVASRAKARAALRPITFP